MSNNSAVCYKVTPVAAKALTKQEIHHVLNEICSVAFADAEWREGKCLRINFTKHGRGFAVALDYRPDGLSALIGLPQEVLGPFDYEDAGGTNGSRI